MGTTVSHRLSGVTGSSSARSYDALELMRDCLFLIWVVIFSALPYIRNIGFYSDDWIFLADLVLSRQHSVLSLARLLLVTERMLPRPMQSLEIAMLYRLFGLDPLGYHVVNLCIFAAGVAILYLVTLELRVERTTGLAIAVVYASLPHFATDRFWLAAFQAISAMTFCFLAFYAGLRGSSERNYGWMLLSTISAVLSLLAYEVTAGLLIALPLVILGKLWIEGHLPHWKVWPRALIGFLGVFITTVFSVFILKIQMLSLYYPRIRPHWPELFRYVFAQTLSFNFVRYGVRLPWSIAHAVLHGLPTDVLLVGTAVAVAVAFYFSHNLPTPRRFLFFRGLLLIGTGMAIFWAGLLAFVPMRMDLSSTGMNNRVAIACGLGTAFMLVGACRLLCNTARSRRFGFAILLGTLCGGNVLLLGYLSSFWVQARSSQAAILRSVREHVPPLQSGSTLLLDGFCPYIGPGVVVETSWDATGLLRLSYRDASLAGDVVSRSTRIDSEGVSTTIYGDIRRYPYGPDLLVYNTRKASYRVLSDREAAEAYFHEKSADEMRCQGRAGVGAPVF
jgi:hypothetical protein